jgi:hypothetical protein
MRTVPLRAVAVLVLCTPLLACGGSVVSGASQGGGADARAANDSGEPACIENPDLSQACTPGTVQCVPNDPNDPCAATNVAECVDGSWWQTSSGTCCRGPDGGQYVSMGGCEVFGSDAAADGEAGDAAGDDAGGVDGGGDDAGGADGGGGDDAGTLMTACGTCASSELCVVTVSGGGPCFPPNDAGVCPNGGTAPPGSCCSNQSTTYGCTPAPGGCNGSESCICGSDICQGCPCSTSHGPVVTVSCMCEAP